MTELTIMTMNTQTDSPLHPFSNRVHALADTVINRHPDLIGTQELTDSMLMEFSSLLPGYSFFGQARHSSLADEHCAVFYRKDRFQLLKDQTLWLSSTPSEPGSKYALSQFPRIVTFGQFRDLQCNTIFTMYNTHLDHNFAIVRNKQAETLVRIILSTQTGPVILTGDFNTIASSRALKSVERTGLTDVFPGSVGSTMRGKAAGCRYHNKPIDHIYVSSYIQVTHHEKIDPSSPSSDHFPLQAEIIY